jgi:RimJ/RimL family protein N-acetyltransferase
VYNIRPIRPEDKPLLVRAIGSMSMQTSYRRFLSPKSRFTDGELRYLTELDFTDHYALVAVDGRDEQLLRGVGRWVRDPERPDRAEVAIVVGDPWQRRGLGTELGMALADAARARGIRRFTATMLSDNVAAQRLFAKISERLEAHHLGIVTELTAELAAAA